MRTLSVVLLLFLTSCTNTTIMPKLNAPDLPDLGAAPELTNQTWLNVEAPLRLSALRGKVVLLEMWTFG